MKIAQRDIVSISLNPTRGREQQGVRPAVVISGDAFHASGMCVVCPLTTSIHNFVGDVILIPGATNKLGKESEVLVGYIRSVSFERISKKIGAIEVRELEKIFEGIDLVLDR